MTSGIAARERELIVEGLASPDDELRRLAVEQLLELPLDEALAGLLEGLGDPSWRVRKAAVERLVACNAGSRVDDALIEALADGENPGRRNSAYEALVAVGTRAIPRLIAALSSRDVDVRKLVVDTLAAIGDPSACEATIGRLSDSDVNVRAAAADALGVIGGDQAGNALKDVAVDGGQDPLVRLSALRALARLDRAVAHSELAAVSEDPVLRPAAFVLLGLNEDEASLACLLKGLALESRPSREAAQTALLRMISRRDGAAVDDLVARVREVVQSCEQVVPASLERLPDADLADRLVLIQFLGLLQDPRGVVPILEAGRDEAIAEVAHLTLEGMGQVAVLALESAWPGLDVELRTVACDLIGSAGGTVAVHLLQSALDESDASLRAAAARALGVCGDASVVPHLVDHLESAALNDDPDAPDEVAALVDGLVALASGDSSGARGITAEVIDLLATRIVGSAEEVRLAIASVLGRIGRFEDGELVTYLLKDASDRVRRAAVEALAHLEPGAASEPLRLALADESPVVRIAAAVALGNSTDPAVVQDLQRLLHDEDSRVRSAAARAIGTHCSLGRVPVEQSVALIGHTLSGDAMVALAGIEALGLVGGEQAARAALPLLERPEPELVQAAVGCIGRHGDSETVCELIGLISHASWAVRAEAVHVLAERGVRRAVPSILRRLEVEQDGFVREGILRALKQLED